MIGRQGIIAALAVSGAMAVAQPAPAATLAVDDDRADCPAAAYTSIQAAIDAAAPGDTVAVCPGTYAEGSGLTGSNALTIAKSLTLRGAGANLVRIRPAQAAGNRIADTALDLRDGTGDVLVVKGTPAAPVAATISGVTVDGGGVFVEAGIVFVDASGAVSRSLVTNVVTSEAANASGQAGGWRSAFPGVGIAHLATGPGAPRELRIDHVRVEKYNQAGVVLDGAGSNGVLTGDQIVGRTVCINYTANGNCSSPSVETGGPLFGQDGVRVLAGATAALTDDTISQNLVQGSGAPVAGQPTGNANLTLGAGVRLTDAGASSVTRSNIVDNAYGVLAGGSTAQVAAENNWWGLWPLAPANGGPQISPQSNPNSPENPVNGNPSPDSAGGMTSSTVDFFPYRKGSQSDPNTGEWPVVNAPGAVADAEPTISLSAARTGDQPFYKAVLTAQADDDFGIKHVTFYDGDTELGAAAAPPYRATVPVPGDDPCGAHDYRAVAEDSAGQTTETTTTLPMCPPPDPIHCCPPPPAPPTLTVGATTGDPNPPEQQASGGVRGSLLSIRVSGSGQRVAVAGALFSGARPAAPTACRGGVVRLEFVRRGHTVLKRRAALGPGCAYRVRVRVPGRGALRVRAFFLGTRALRPSRASTKARA